MTVAEELLVAAEWLEAEGRGWQKQLGGDWVQGEYERRAAALLKLADRLAGGTLISQDLCERILSGARHLSCCHDGGDPNFHCCDWGTVVIELESAQRGVLPGDPETRVGTLRAELDKEVPHGD